MIMDLIAHDYDHEDAIRELLMFKCFKIFMFQMLLINCDLKKQTNGSIQCKWWCLNENELAMQCI